MIRVIGLSICLGLVAPAPALLGAQPSTPSPWSGTVQPRGQSSLSSLPWSSEASIFAQGEDDPPPGDDDDDAPIDIPDDQFVAREVLVIPAVGVSIDVILATYAVQLLEAFEPLRAYRISTPANLTDEEFVLLLDGDTRIQESEVNLLFEPPEVERRNLAFLDGSPSANEYVDQSAVGRLRLESANLFSTGAGVTVAVIDTGLDLTHPLFAGRTVPGFDFLDNDSDPSEVADGVDENQDGLVDPSFGHGTHVAGLVVLAAPQARIMPLRCFSAEGEGDAYAIAKAIWFAVETGARVINMSFGLTYRSAILSTSLSRAFEAGLHLVASAGNGGLANAPPYPARKLEVMAVAATDAEDRRADFSNYGTFVDISAPGIDLYSAFPNGGAAIWSGTSMAAPLVSGAIARLCALNLPQPAIEQAVLDAAWPIAAVNPGLDGLLGSGRIDALAAVERGLGWSEQTPSLKLEGTPPAPLLSAIQSGPDLTADFYYGFVGASGEFHSLGASGFEPGLFPTASAVVLSSGFAIAAQPLPKPPADAVLVFVALTDPGTLNPRALSTLQQ